MFRELTDIVLNKNFKVVIYQNKVSISNYEDVLIFDDQQVLIKTEYKYVKIKGEMLVITRLENKEVLIEGKIKTIDVED